MIKVNYYPEFEKSYDIENKMSEVVFERKEQELVEKLSINSKEVI